MGKKSSDVMFIYNLPKLNFYLNLKFNFEINIIMLFTKMIKKYKILKLKDTCKGSGLLFLFSIV